MKITGFCGAKGSGKTTLATAQAATRVAFADPIKEMLKAFLKYQGASAEEIHRMIYNDLKETPSSYLGGKSPRYAMQTLGTEWGRNLMHRDLWITAWSNRLHVLGEPPNVTVDDVRHTNEVHAIHSAGGKVIAVTRPEYQTSDTHSSENWQSLNYDHVITNDGTREELFRKFNQLAKGDKG